MWHLLLRIGADSVHAVLYSTVEDNSLIYRRFTITPDAGSRIAAIENIIYDNPALLSDFGTVWCVIETREYALIPLKCFRDSSQLFRAAFPDSTSEPLLETTGTNNAALVLGIEPELRAFINRTFHRVIVTSHLALLCRYFSAIASQGNRIKMVANIRDGALDVIAVDGHRLLLANTFSYSSAADAAYYVLACRQKLGLDGQANEILLTGKQSVREELTPILRTYVSRVMPAIFPPQMFKAGKDSMLAPFDLIIAPICE